jgi:hypothetical protein
MHFKCIGVTRQQADALLSALCNSCSIDSDDESLAICEQGEESAQQPSTSTGQATARTNNEWDVKRILNHAEMYASGKIQRWFLLEWAVWADDAGPNDQPTLVEDWELEENLVGCVGLLKLYLAKEKLRPTTLRERAKGGATGAKFDERNWVTVDDVLRVITSNRNLRDFKSNVEIGEWTGFGQEKKISILLHDGHFFVILYVPSEKWCLIADQTNKFCKDKNIERQLRTLLKPPKGVRLLKCEVHCTSKADYCGTAAVLIALNFSKFVRKTQTKFHIFLFGLTLENRIAKAFHKFKSCATKEWNLADLVKCPGCAQNFPRQQIWKLRKHMDQCPMVKKEV